MHAAVISQLQLCTGSGAGRIASRYVRADEHKEGDAARALVVEVGSGRGRAGQGRSLVRARALG